MVAYLMRWDQSSSGSATALSVTAVSWPIRLAQINLWTASGETNFTAYRYEGGSASSGSSAPIVTLRQGAPAATATARLGALSFTGTQRVIGATYMGSGQTDKINPGPPASATVIFTGTTATFPFPLTTVIKPGSTLAVVTSGVTSTWNTNTGCEIYFEELRLQGSF